MKYLMSSVAGLKGAERIGRSCRGDEALGLPCKNTFACPVDTGFRFCTAGSHLTWILLSLANKKLDMAGLRHVRLRLV